MTDQNDFYRLFPKFPAAELRAYLEARERNITDLGFHAISQVFLMGITTREDGAEIPHCPPIPLRYSVPKAMDDWQQNPGHTICFVTRSFDPSNADEMAAYERHKAAAEQESGECAP